MRPTQERQYVLLGLHFDLSINNVFRFTIDPTKGTVTSGNLTPPGYDNIEFSQFNHDYEGLPYKYGYILRYPYVAGCQIVKMNMDDPTGNSNLGLSISGYLTLCIHEF